MEREVHLGHMVTKEHRGWDLNSFGKTIKKRTNKLSGIYPKGAENESNLRPLVLCYPWLNSCTTNFLVIPPAHNKKISTNARMFHHDKTYNPTTRSWAHVDSGGTPASDLFGSFSLSLGGWRSVRYDPALSNYFGIIGTCSLAGPNLIFHSIH